MISDLQIWGCVETFRFGFFPKDGSPFSSADKQAVASNFILIPILRRALGL